MKITKYFITQVSNNQLQQGIDNVVRQRDEFIKLNKSDIAKIDEEDIKVESIPNHILLILKLTYYPQK